LPTAIDQSFLRFVSLSGDENLATIGTSFRFGNLSERFACLTGV